MNNSHINDENDEYDNERIRFDNYGRRIHYVPNRIIALPYIPNEIPTEQHNEIPNEHHNEIPNEHHNEIPNEQHNEIPNEHHNEIPNEHHNGTYISSLTYNIAFIINGLAGSQFSN
jgi:hypothetical protein